MCKGPVTFFTTILSHWTRIWKKEVLIKNCRVYTSLNEAGGKNLCRKCKANKSDYQLIIYMVVGIIAHITLRPKITIFKPFNTN